MNKSTNSPEFEGIKPMTADEILTRIENDVQSDIISRYNGRPSKSPKTSHSQALAELKRTIERCRTTTATGSGKYLHNGAIDDVLQALGLEEEKDD